MRKCRDCHAPVIWATHKTNHTRNMLDIEPSEHGNILYDSQTGFYEVLSGEDLERARDMPCLKLYISHFATCQKRRL